MSTTAFLARQPAAPSSTPEIGTTVWLLHTWDHYDDKTELYVSYDDALHALAKDVRSNWTSRIRTSAGPENLTDLDAVSKFYGVLPFNERVTGGGHDSDGFEIVEHQVHGRAPERVDRRTGTLRVFDDPALEQRSPLTYRLDAMGLAITVTAGMYGPFVAIGNESLPAGTALHVAADDFEGWEG